MFELKKYISLQNLILLFTGCAILFGILSFFLPFKHDYVQYIIQWQRVLNGASPYETPSGNFKMFWYGPLHNVFVPFYQWHPNLPRLLFFASWALAAFFLTKDFLTVLPSKKEWLFILVLAFCLLNPYLVQLFVYGQNDLMVGGLLFFAIWFHHKAKVPISALFFVLAFTYKLYPIILMPYFFYNNSFGTVFKPKEIWERIQWNYIGWFLIFVIATMSLQYLVFGLNGLKSYFFVLDRNATSSSLYYFLREVLNFQIPNSWSLIVALVGLFVLAFGYLFNRIDRHAGMILAILVLFITSRVYFFAYQACLLLLLPFYQYVQLKNGRDFKIWKYFALIATLFLGILVVERVLNIPLRNYKGLLYVLPNLFLMAQLLIHQKRVRP